MNQFKKAKQLRMESGQTTESITDLKTVGVTQNEEIISPKNLSNSKSDMSDLEFDKKNDSSNILPKSQSLTTSNIETIPNTTQEIITQSPKKLNVDSKINGQVISSSVKENEIKDQITSNDIQSVAITNTELDKRQTFDTDALNSINILPNVNESIPMPTNNITTISQPSADNMNVQSIAPPINSNINMTSPIQSSHIIVTENATHALTAPIRSSDIPSAPAIPQTSGAAQTQETSNTKQNKPVKKSAPNIFAPKGEAKSMRKSLVLKPTSVKIAENYCSKNGGSFNELIQTLLDNFINEYGL